jgi:hypothetical protein
MASMDLPVEAQIRWVLRRSATLLRLGAEPVRGLIQPTGEFFPDRFDGSPRSLGDLLARVQDHAGLGDLRTELSVVSPEGEEVAKAGGCSTGACGPGGKLDVRIDRVARRQDGSYQVTVGSGEVRNPTVLTTAFIRSVACMFLSEAGAYDELLPEEREPATDLGAVLLGFGVLAANGSYIYMKGCGSVQVHSATRMPVDETTLALAVYCALHGVPERVAARHLAVTPRAHFEEASVWAGSNSAVIRLLRGDPELVEGNDFSLNPPGSWLGRLLRSKKRATARATSDDLAELERSLATEPAQPRERAPVDPARAKRLAEIKGLVDETLEG